MGRVTPFLSPPKVVPSGVFMASIMARAKCRLDGPISPVYGLEGVIGGRPHHQPRHDSGGLLLSSHPQRTWASRFSIFSISLL
eukprot:364195-Chlamydomonas_euryale.AAC.9